VFTDPDPIEELLGKCVTEMVDQELVTYARLSLKAWYDLDLPTTAQRERSIMACLQRTYGPDAGLVVKWALQHEPATYSMFSVGQKWRTDKWYVELQKHIKVQKANTTVVEGFSKLENL
jgi:hypothetical protein